MLSPSSHGGTSGSPPKAQTTGTKRKRKALSCYDCRRRKLKCDREYPSCSRCQKAGLAGSCSYDERSLASRHVFPAESPALKQSTSTPQASSEWSSSAPVAHTRRINELSQGPSTVEASQTSGTWQLRGEVSPIAKDSEQRPAVKADAQAFEICERRPRTPTETIIFRGETFKTHYYGGSNPTSLIAHFPELRLFMREAIMQHTSLPRVQRDLKALQGRWKEDKTNVSPFTDPELLQLLPDRDNVDYLVQLYFDTCETLYRIMHRPSFWKEYELFWSNQQAASPAFVVILLLMMAAVSCISTKDPQTYIGDSSMARERAVLLIEVSESWLERHSKKNIYLAIWQIRCLLILAKQVNIVKKKRTWTVAGTLVREAMSAGFHRDPGLLGEKVSVFDQEMRRRLWTTMIELELQASIDRGMPSATAGVPSDSTAILNVNDDELTVEHGNSPTQKPWSESTACSFLHISTASFTLRVSLNSLVNDLSSTWRYEEVLNHEELVTKELRKLPRQAATGVSPGAGDLPVMARALLDIQLRQFLILLHAPFARQADSNSRYSLSRMVCLNAAASIVEQYSQLTASDKYLLLLLRHDYFRAALNVCHTMYISISIQNDLFFNSQSNTFIRYLDGALILLEERITRLGTGYTHYWYISAACALLRSAIRPEESSAQKQQAVDRVARQYYRILASQEEFVKAKEKIFPACLCKENIAVPELQIFSTNTNVPRLSFFDPSMAQPTYPQVDLPLEEFYFGDPSAWTFDNLWGLEN